MGINLISSLFIYGDVGYVNYWDAEDTNTVTKACSPPYKMATKCKQDLDGYYPNYDVTGCALVSELWGVGLLFEHTTCI